MLCTALPLTPRALPHRYPGCTARCPRRLAGRPDGPGPQNPDFAEWVWGKIQISRNEGRGGTQNTEFTGYQDSSTEIAKSTLFNFPNFYDACCCRSCCQNPLKPQGSNAGRTQKNVCSAWRPSVVFWEAERHPKNHRGAPAGLLLLPRSRKPLGRQRCRGATRWAAPGPDAVFQKTQTIANRNLSRKIK